MTKHRGTLGPLECAHCGRIWYGIFFHSETRKVIPHNTILCVSCWFNLDNYLLHHIMTNIDDLPPTMEGLAIVHAEAKKWINDKKKKPFPVKKRFGKSVPKWMRSAIDAGMVKTNGKEVYIVYSEGDTAIKVDLADRSNLSPFRMR